MDIIRFVLVSSLAALAWSKVEDSAGQALSVTLLGLYCLVVGVQLVRGRRSSFRQVLQDVVFDYMSRYRLAGTAEDRARARASAEDAFRRLRLGLQTPVTPAGDEVLQTFTAILHHLGFADYNPRRDRRNGGAGKVKKWPTG
jgi:hypothetical protein